MGQHPDEGDANVVEADNAEMQEKYEGILKDHCLSVSVSFQQVSSCIAPHPLDNSLPSQILYSDLGMPAKASLQGHSWLQLVAL